MAWVHGVVVVEGEDDVVCHLLVDIHDADHDPSALATFEKVPAPSQPNMGQSAREMLADVVLVAVRANMLAGSRV